jgi:hypothetical protein
MSQILCPLPFACAGKFVCVCPKLSGGFLTSYFQAPSLWNLNLNEEHKPNSAAVEYDAVFRDLWLPTFRKNVANFKHRHPLTKPHSGLSQKNWTLSNTALWTSCFAEITTLTSFNNSINNSEKSVKAYAKLDTIKNEGVWKNLGICLEKKKVTEEEND